MSLLGCENQFLSIKLVITIFFFFLENRKELIFQIGIWKEGNVISLTTQVHTFHMHKVEIKTKIK